VATTTTYQYVARDQAGGSLTGEIAAANETEAARRLRDEGKFVVRLDAQAARAGHRADAPSVRTGRVKKVEVIYFASQMAIMVETGVPVADALDGIIRQTSPGPFKRVLTELLRQVEGGSQFSEALARHPKVFGSMFINLVRASEMSGRLGETLSSVAAYMTRQREIVAKVRGALIYPMVLVAMSIGMVVFLMTYMLPKFIIIYKGKMDLLPRPTKILIAISNFMVDYWWAWSGALALIIVGMLLSLRTVRGRRIRDWLALHAPLIGPMYSKTLVTRSLQTIGTLTDSGVSVLDTISITRRIIRNSYFRELWDRIDTSLQRGQQLSAPMYSTKLFPRPIVQMIEAGERSGKVGMVMRKVSVFLEEELEHTIRSTTRMIEPIMISLMGVIVGSIAIAMLLPIFSMSKVVAH
jgi:type IV pilus assembly protein PilC